MMALIELISWYLSVVYFWGMIYIFNIGPLFPCPMIGVYACLLPDNFYYYTDQPSICIVIGCAFLLSHGYPPRLSFLHQFLSWQLNE